MCRIMASHKRILSALGKGPARRNLFGPVDREQLQVEYQAALQKDLEEASDRWGFDFISDKPLESSDFQWEGIPGTKVPLLYRSCMLGLEQAEGQRAPEAAGKSKGGRVELPWNEKENIPCSPKRCAVDQENLEKTPVRRENTGLKRKQTNITDFYQAKRRVVWMPHKSGE
ncbi:cyclin-dependent kinase inhibitor 1 isoform X1 [Chaetodon trifascialis]|uniref:cyclin-dependent kinase inhibitor 1 isoform X1 n=2 Tax=Chaetodon trifascialis TaxID=109706 RepID=UPI0039934C70